MRKLKVLAMVFVSMFTLAAGTAHAAKVFDVSAMAKANAKKRAVENRKVSQVVSGSATRDMQGCKFVGYVRVGNQYKRKIACPR